MLSSSRVTQKKSLVIYGLLSFFCVASAIFIVYNDYVRGTDNVATDFYPHAFQGGLYVAGGDEVETIQKDVSSYFDVGMFSKKQFLNLKEGYVPERAVQRGTANPFNTSN